MARDLIDPDTQKRNRFFLAPIKFRRNYALVIRNSAPSS